MRQITKTNPDQGPKEYDLINLAEGGGDIHTRLNRG